MINTIYFDHEFNFLLLENTQEENSESITKIYLNIETDATTGQRLEISVAGGAVVTENIASDTVVNFELSQEYWADDNATEITPKNDDITGETITINFPKTFTTSAALNYIADNEFDLQAQNEAFAESGSSGSGSGGAAFDFVEIIRNIGFRLLDEPENVNCYYDETSNEVRIKWTDPADIATNEPAPATWAGTVVVRKEGSAPLHRWDGVEIIDSTTRDEYSTNILVDNTVQIEKNYYYGIFPYDTNGYYRYTKVIFVTTTFKTSTEFDYTGAIETFTAMKDGVYKLEIWGAQGGTVYDGENTTASGGYGSYSVGEVELHQGDTLYIVVGGQGGYNGGGAGS